MNRSPGSLALGWKIDSEGHPAYWMRSNSILGKHSSDDLVCIPANRIANHTAIIAQSGSGKSFFLGRFVEEILLNTRCRIAILDPNADFRNSGAIEPAMWENTGYDPAKFLGKMPTEADVEQVKKSWQSIGKRIYRGDISEHTDNYEPARLWWPILATELLSENLGPSESVEMRLCHTFVQSIARILKARIESQSDNGAVSNRLLDFSQEAMFQLLAAREPNTTASEMANRLAQAISFPDGGVDLDMAARSAQCISLEVAKYYFARAREIDIAGMLAQTPPASLGRDIRQLVFDLPSLPNAGMRLLVAHQILTRLWAMQQEAWQEAMLTPGELDRRVPHFIVVDEAHNLVPAEPRSPAAFALRETFRTIAAEGRKFGLFLIVVSQRPDKLDPMILSACENKIIMRIDSSEVIEKIKAAMGLPPDVAAQLPDCLKFRTGRGLLFGGWAPDGPVKFMSASRRTVEGGRNLNADWWGQP